MYYFIVNTKSRSGKSLLVWKNVRKVLKEANVEFKAYETQYEGHALKLAKDICKKKDEDKSLIIVGGDGTVNEVINGINDNGIEDFDKVKVGLIPAGSGNDFARGLGISGNETDIIKEILEREKIAKDYNEKKSFAKIDIGQVLWKEDNLEKSRVFAISSGVGLDAIVCKKTNTSKLKKVLNKVKLGKLTYILLTVETLFSMTTFMADIKVKDEKFKLNKVIFMANMNVRAEGGGVPMAPNANPADGNLHMCMACGIPKWRTFFCLPLLVMAKHEGIKGFDIIDNEECEIVTDKPIVLHADGEYLADTKEIKYICLKEKLCILNKVK
ncbi:MAG: YegS/Rv2252/BmrU family lipid kinase [Lachnospiraceae bacterium]|nr:YegS/Rv2252/BmrU family lipid kinase [Lachnospiraceae bacterium]